MRVTCSLFFLFFTFLITAPAAPVLAATESNYFERNLQQVGKKLDAAKAKGEEATAELREEAATVYEDAREEAKKTKETVRSQSSDWKKRLGSAFHEVKEGMKRAWSKLVDQNQAQDSTR
ncbi:MAG: hypothetical protein AB7G93_12865 [Bdellovibrionales bacterium]